MKVNIIARLIEINADDLRYYQTLKPSFMEAYYMDSIERNIRILRNLSQMAKQNGQEDLAARADDAMAAFAGN